MSFFLLFFLIIISKHSFCGKILHFTLFLSIIEYLSLREPAETITPKSILESQIGLAFNYSLKYALNIYNQLQ